MSRSVRSKSWFRNKDKELTDEFSCKKPAPVKYICPKTGEYITKEESLANIPKETTLEHYLRNYRGRQPFLISLKTQVIKGGFESLTEKQITAAENFRNTSKRGKDYKVNQALKMHAHRKKTFKDRFKDDYVSPKGDESEAKQIDQRPSEHSEDAES